MAERARSHLHEADGVHDGHGFPIARPRPGQVVPHYSFRYGEVEESKDKRVTLLRLAENVQQRGWVISPHTHPHFSQMILVQQGSGSMKIEGEDRHFAAPAILIVPALAIHGFAYARDADGWVLTISDTYLNDFSSRAPEFHELFGRGRCITEISEGERDELGQVILRIEQELDQAAWGQQIATEAMLLDMFVKVLRIIRNRKANEIPVRGANQQIFKHFLKLVEERYKQNWSVEEFAAEMAITAGRLRAACRNVSDESPIRVINDRVILEAKRYLAYTSRSVSEIAYELGFDDPSYFSRFFKSKQRETPADFRERVLTSH